MEFRALSLCFLLLYVGYCNANSEGTTDYESYWHSLFPTDTPFPKVLQEFLPSGELQRVPNSKFDSKNVLPRSFGPGRKNILPQPYGVSVWANKKSLPQPYGVGVSANKNMIPQAYGVLPWANRNSIPQPFGVGVWANKNMLPQPYGVGVWANKNSLPQPYGVGVWANRNSIPQPYGVAVRANKNMLPQPYGVGVWANKNSLPQPYGVGVWANRNSIPQPYGVGVWANKNTLPQPYGVGVWANKNSLPQPYGFAVWANENPVPQPWRVGSWGSKDAGTLQRQFVSEKTEPITTNVGADEATDLTSYFFEKDLVVGNKMTMEFQKAVTEAKLLPRQVIESIPFSIKKLPEILSLFNINPKSVDAKIVKETLQLCERPLNPLIEVQFCTTSFESLIDYVVSRLGRNNVQAYATEADSEEKKEYTIEENGVEMLGDRSVICHLQNYVHAVFYCHELKSTKAFRVSLSASDGAKAKAVVLCHHDTSGSNPNNLPFRMLNVMPGHEFPICHFLVRGSHAWVTSSVLSDE